jgi:8-oxo-dGTP diphosphatase
MVIYEGTEQLYCEPCEKLIFHNPGQITDLTVIGGDRVLLVKRAVGTTAGDWTIPGRHIEIGEQPNTAAARELREETGLTVDPADLKLFYLRTLPRQRKVHSLIRIYHPEFHD